MLIRFAVENFASFKDMTEFNMTAGKITRHKDHVATCKGKRILKGAFLFGANASGKTNLIRAISFARNVIVNGLEKTNCDRKYFRIENAYKFKPSVFQFDIFSNGHFYSYGFALSLLNRSIEEEWLYQIDDTEKCIFLRVSADENSRPTVDTDLKFSSDKEQSRFELYAEDIRNPKMSQTLFLSDVAMRSPDSAPEFQAFRDVITWIQKLTIIFPDSQFDSIVELMDDSNERTRLEKLLQYFDTGINSIQKKSVEFDKTFDGLPEQILDSIKADITKNLKSKAKRAQVLSDDSRFEIGYSDGELTAYKIFANHGNDDDLFEYSDESDGTQRLFNLIPLYQRVLQDGVIIIDELDRSLHTKAVQEFINYFYRLADNHHSQLIITTHDSNILDLDFIRQDEIWFIDRQPDHSSDLYSLNQFMVRFDKKVEKDYLLGRYRAIPVFRQYLFETDEIEEGDVDGYSDQ